MKVPATVLRALRRAAEAHGVPLELLAAIVAQESGFNPLMVGDLNAGVALGLGQQNLKGAGGAYLGAPWRLLLPDVNADATAAYLRECMDAFPADTYRAVSAYNQGIGGAQVPNWYQVNGSSYVQPVDAFWQQIKQEGLEEDWDPDVTDDFRQFGKTWWDVAVILKGVADDALSRLRQAGDLAARIVELRGRL